VPRPKSKGLKIFLWFTCSVVFALLPLVISYINGRVDGKPPGWVDLLASGELFLIAAAVAADAVGRVFIGGERKRNFRISCGVGCALLLLVTSIYFGRIAFAVDEHRTAVAEAVEARNIDLALDQLHHTGVDRATNARDSLLLFGLTVAAAFGVILVEEE
jgi:hypothetical protein